MPFRPHDANLKESEIIAMKTLVAGAIVSAFIAGCGSTAPVDDGELNAAAVAAGFDRGALSGDWVFADGTFSLKDLGEHYECSWQNQASLCWLYSSSPQSQATTVANKTLRGNYLAVNTKNSSRQVTTKLYRHQLALDKNTLELTLFAQKTVPQTEFVDNKNFAEVKSSTPLRLFRQQALDRLKGLNGTWETSGFHLVKKAQFNVATDGAAGFGCPFVNGKQAMQCSYLLDVDYSKLPVAWDDQHRPPTSKDQFIRITDPTANGFGDRLYSFKMRDDNAVVLKEVAGEDVTKNDPKAKLSPSGANAEFVTYNRVRLLPE
ncbi:MAG: hypothetical protein NVSMB1_01850 [Polyangiales bacterium]